MKSIMQRILLPAFVMATVTATAQWDKNGGIIFLKWGYQGGSTKVDNFFYQTNPSDYSNLTQSPQLTNAVGIKYQNKAIFMEMETVQKNLMFGFRLGYGLKKSVPNQPGFIMRDATYLNAFFGYGFHIKQYFSLIPTLRYNWSLAMQEGSPTLPAGTNKYFSKLGGNQRGFGLNLVVPVGEKLLIRAGYYYEWIFREKKVYKGIAKTPELELYLPLDDDHTFGFSLKISTPRRKMLDNFNANAPASYQPTVNFNSFLWEASISVPLPSASTTNYVITVME
jgi:hypothetical protein